MHLRWRHCIINARCTWLHADPRGFRSRNHRIHSTGDYKHKPPITEHAQLRAFHQNRSRDPIAFDIQMREIILYHFVQKLRELNYRIIACSVGESHLHALTELPHNLEQIRKIIGKCKQRASHAIRNLIPGTIWSAGGEFRWIRDKRHLNNTYRYIRTRQERGTVVWSHREDENWIDGKAQMGAIQSPLQT